MPADRSSAGQAAGQLNWNGESPIIFLHIPKTAGTTLHRIIDRQYPPNAVCSFGADAHASVAQFKAMDASEKKKIRLLRGHMAFGLHEYLPNNPQYFTFLREPVARVISYYNFIRRTPDHYLYDEVVGNDLSLHALLESGLPLMMNDAQVRLIAGVWGDPGFGQVTEEMLNIAKQNLVDYFIVVGLTEQFDKSLLLLKEKLDWQHDITYLRQNVTTGGLTVNRMTPETYELIKQTNQKDIDLYAFARQFFQKQCARQGATFRLRLTQFQLLNNYGFDINRWRTYSLRTKIKNLGSPK